MVLKPTMPKKTAVQVSYTLSSDEDDAVENESSDTDTEIKEELLSDGEDGDLTGSALEDAEVKSEPEDNEDAVPTNKGLANVMAQILNKKTKKTAILAKAKTDKQISLAKKRKPGSDEDEDSKDKIKTEPEETESSLQKHKRRKLWENMSRMKPDVLEREKERGLQRVATRGVVQLFNAVRQQQKNVEEKLKDVGSSVRKQDIALDTFTKGQFVDVLKAKAGKDKPTIAVKDEVKEEAETDSDTDPTQPSWGILRDDFMMGAKMKDWDKRDDSDDDADVSDAGQSDFSDT